LEGAINLKGNTSREHHFLTVMEKLGSDIVATVGDAEVKENLKKLSKNLRKIIDLKKHANVMAAVFLCLCV
jgi:hypothetical protein